VHARAGLAKQQLRARFGAARAAMPETRREQARAAIRAAVLPRVDDLGARCVAAYVPFRTEPGSPTLLEELTARRLRVLVPVTLADRDLDWAEWTTDGAGSPLGTNAIAAADVVLVPALAVATDGTRLGRGGGSYDRALARCRQHAPIAALLFSGEFVESLPRDPWDHPVTAVVTPDGWRSLE
jgi:5-formyltetrahydrofolate cyclo-ligase